MIFLIFILSLSQASSTSEDFEVFVQPALVQAREYAEENLTVSVECMDGSSECLDDRKLYFEVDSSQFKFRNLGNNSYGTTAPKWSDPTGYQDNFIELSSFKDGEQTFFFTPELLGIYQLDFYSKIGEEKHYFKNARYLNV